jgi:hypothetical protein
MRPMVQIIRPRFNLMFSNSVSGMSKIGRFQAFSAPDFRQSPVRFANNWEIEWHHLLMGFVSINRVVAVFTFNNLA